jgi:hypothetical protein
LTCDVAYIDLNLSNNYQITGNIFSSDADGPAAIRAVGGSVAGGNQYSSNGAASDNTINVKRYGIYFGTATHVLAAGNIINSYSGTAEGIDFENCSHFTADGNKIYNSYKPFGIFYKYSDGLIQNNHVELIAGAEFFIQHGSAAAPTGDISILDNTVKRSGTPSSFAKLQLSSDGGELNLSGNDFTDVILENTGVQSRQFIKGNKFTWTLDDTTTKLLVADASDYTGTVAVYTDNEFIGVKSATYINGTVINCPIDSAGGAVVISRNTFSKLGIPLIHVNATAAASTRYLFTDNILETINYAYGPTSGLAAGSKNLYFEGLRNGNGLDYFGSTANFSSIEGSYGAALGSSFRRNPPVTGQAWGWVNTSNTGTPTWTVIATLP